MVAEKSGGDIFLLLPQVLLEGGASMDDHGAAGLGLLAVRRLLNEYEQKGEENL